MYDTNQWSDDKDAPRGCGPLHPTQAEQTGPLRQQVFAFVRAKGRASRAEIARGLGVSAGSVTTISADLINTNLLQEVDDQPRESGRGRPPVALSVRATSHYVIGIKLTDSRHCAVLTDFAGRQIADASLQVPSLRKTATGLQTEISDLIDALLIKADLPMSRVIGIGIGIPGIVLHETGVIPWSPLIIGRDTPLGQQATHRFGIPVLIDNDANVLTLAELWFGEGRDRPDFAVVTVEHGVGMGLVLNNRLYRGSRGMGLELGHTKVQLDGALCRCGQRGCLEAYLADYALSREAVTALGRAAPITDHATLISDLFDEAQSGNSAARTIFARAGRFLALGLANVIQLFDPAFIILAGERMRYNYLYSEDVLREMRALTLSEGRTPCQVDTHLWGDMVWAQGASALALSALSDGVLAETS